MQDNLWTIGKIHIPGIQSQNEQNFANAYPTGRDMAAFTDF